MTLNNGDRFHDCFGQRGSEKGCTTNSIPIVLVVRKSTLDYPCWFGRRQLPIGRKLTPNNFKTACR
eukprot:4846858-Amphidinium_carterae.1